MEDAWRKQKQESSRISTTAVSPPPPPQHHTRSLVAATASLLHQLALLCAIHRATFQFQYMISISIRKILTCSRSSPFQALNTQGPAERRSTDSCAFLASAHHTRTVDTLSSHHQCHYSSKHRLLHVATVRQQQQE